MQGKCASGDWAIQLIQKVVTSSQMKFGQSMNQESALFLPSVADTKQLLSLDLHESNLCRQQELRPGLNPLGEDTHLSHGGDKDVYYLKSRGK